VLSAKRGNNAYKGEETRVSSLFFWGL